MNIYISSGLHIGPSRSRINAIRENTGDIDAVFIESPKEKPSAIVKLLNVVAVPSMMIVVVVYTLVLRVLGYLGAEDRAIAEEVADDKEIYEVDKDLHEIVARDRAVWFTVHWLLLISPPYLLLDYDVNQYVSDYPLPMVAVVGLSLLAIFTAVSLYERNLHMIAEIDRIREENSIQESCLITGKMHESGIKRLSANYDQITIINGENE